MQRSRERGESVAVGDRERLRACGMLQKRDRGRGGKGDR